MTGTRTHRSYNPAKHDPTVCVYPASRKNPSQLQLDIHGKVTTTEYSNLRVVSEVLS